MPRRKLSPRSRLAARTRSQALWRQGLAQRASDTRSQAGQFINIITAANTLPNQDSTSKPGTHTQQDNQQADNQGGDDPWDFPLIVSGEAEPAWSAHQTPSPEHRRRQSSLSGSRRSSRRSSSLAQSRISNYYRVSKSISPSKASSVASRLSRTLSVVLQSANSGPIASPITDDEFHELSSTPSENQEANLNEEDNELAAQEQLLGEERAVDIAAQLGQHLLQFHGCEPNTHNQARKLHFQDWRRLTNHHSLSDLETLIGQVPDVLGQPKLLKHNGPEQALHIEWARIFEGKHAEVGEGEEEEEEERMHVCLYSSEQQHRRMLIRYDIDSALGYATSLAFARRGLMINFAPQFHTNIRINLHLYTHVTYDYGRGPRQVRLKLHELPHYCLGYLSQQEHTKVYVFFPRQWHPEKQTNFPGQKDDVKHKLLQVWTDEILLPAIARHVSSDDGQHMPSSWRQARLNAEARFREANTRSKGASLHQMLHYALQPGVLDTIWRDIQQRLEEPEYALYRGAHLFFSSKNTKSVYKGTTLAQMWKSFNTQLVHTFNFQYLDEGRFWLDLGKETVCREWCLPQQDLISNQSPATYLMRSCCLEAFYQWSHFGEPASRAKKTVYVPAMLSGSYDMTVEMSANSTKRVEGWIFYQMYNSYKEMTDIAKTKPFRSRFLGQLAWDSEVRALIEQAGGGRPVSAAKVKESYRSSKVRLASALSEGQKKSYGVREEHRVSLTFLRQIKESLTAAGTWEQPPHLTVAQYPFWELSSDTYTTFLAPTSFSMPSSASLPPPRTARLAMSILRLLRCSWSLPSIATTPPRFHARPACGRTGTKSTEQARLSKEWGSSLRLKSPATGGSCPRSTGSAWYSGQN